MKIPFADLFQKSKARLTPAPPKPKGDVALPSVKKSERERLGKTVLPSSARGPSQAEQTEEKQKSGGIGTEMARVPGQTRRLAALPSQIEPAGETPAGRTGETPVLRPKISMGGAPVAPAPHLPPAVANALEPNIERAISLPLADVIAQMPDGYLKPRESFDANRPILLRAAEVEKGMATGRPAIRVAALFQQAPDIFMHTVPTTDGTMVALPFERVMKALSNLSQRTDQAIAQAVPQVETPFLQVTMEDTERFGLPMSAQPTRLPPQTEGAELPPVRIETASAEAFAAAVPEAKETFVPPKPAETDATEGTSARGAMRIPFTPQTEPDMSEQFGTGEPAFPRVPASSGPPVPSAQAASSAPARIPFDLPAPSDEPSKDEGRRLAATSKLQDEERKQRSEAGGQKSKVGGGDVAEPVLTLPLRPILQELPPMLLGGNPVTVPAEVTVSFPISIIAPQLASGKVVVKPNAFYAALPEQYRKLFLADAVNAPVQLPLADVLAHLPGEALRMRADQEVHAPRQIFETPFSAKAAEDAARLARKNEGGGEACVSKAEGDELPRHLAQAPLQPEAVPKFDARDAVVRACAVDGVSACSVIFADGLSIAGSIPDSMHLGGLSAVAPTLLQKLGKHMLETSLGPLTCMTLHGEKSPVSFFAAGNICLTAVHERELGETTRRELSGIAGELSRAYSQPESPSRTGG